MRELAPRPPAEPWFTGNVVELTISDSPSRDTADQMASSLGRVTGLTQRFGGDATRPWAAPQQHRFHDDGDDAVPQYLPLPYTIVSADVVGSGVLDDCGQLQMRASLHAVFGKALRLLRIDRTAINVQDLGDAIRLIIDARVSPKLLLDPFIPYLAETLRQLRAANPARRLRLRVVVHTGLLHRDPIGWAGAPLVHCARLIEAEPLRRTMSHAREANLALIVSQTVYDAIVWHGYGLDRDTYLPVRINAKETSTLAWIHVPGHRVPPGLPTVDRDIV